MKSTNQLLYGLFSAICLLLSFSACTEEADYTGAEQPTNAQVYFPTTMPAQVDFDREKSSYDVLLERANTDGQLTVNLTVTEESGLLTIPSSATFAAGESTAKLTIGYDLETLGYEKYVPVELNISDESLTTPYGTAKYAFKAGVPAPYTSLGIARFRDTFIFGDEYKCELMQCDLDPNTYRLMDPYSEGLKAEEWDTEDAQSPYIEFTVLKPGNKLAGVTITGNDLVHFKDACTGAYMVDYKANINIFHPAKFVKYAEEESWQYNRVLMYQEDGKPAVVQLAPYYYMLGVGGWDQTQANGLISIIFPDVIIKDYSVEVDYLGRLTDPKDNNFALANITMGEDLEIVKYAMVEGDDIEAAMSGIIDGSIASTEIEKGGEVKIKSDLSGKCSIVAVGFTGDKAQEMGYATFEFATSAGAKWESLGMAEYTDDFIASLYKVPGPTYEVEVLANSDKPGIYRLVNPYGEAFPYNEPGDWDDSQDYYLDINAEDPDGVYIDFQESGLLWFDPDRMSFGSWASMYLAAGYPLEQIKAAGYCGTLKDGVITFPEASLGILIGGDEYDANLNSAFKLVLPEAAAASTSAAKAATRTIPGKAIKSGSRTLKAKPVKKHIRKYAEIRDFDKF